MSRDKRHELESEQVADHRSLELQLQEPDEAFWLELRDNVWSQVDPDRPTGRRHSLQVLIPATTALVVLCLVLFWWWGREGDLTPGGGRFAAIEASGRASLDELVAVDISSTEVGRVGSAEDQLVELIAETSLTELETEQILIADGVDENPALWDAILNEELELRDLDDLIQQLNESELMELSTRLQELQG